MVGCLRLPIGLIGMNVTLRYENYDHIEVFLDDEPRGYLSLLNEHSNSKIQRAAHFEKQKGSLFEKAAGDE